MVVLVFPQTRPSRLQSPGEQFLGSHGLGRHPYPAGGRLLESPRPGWPQGSASSLLVLCTQATEWLVCSGASQGAAACAPATRVCSLRNLLFAGGPLAVRSELGRGLAAAKGAGGS